jgi:hypothetical protein
MRKSSGVKAAKRGKQQRHFTVRVRKPLDCATVSRPLGSDDDLAGVVLPGFKMIPDWKPAIEAKPGQAKIGLYAHLGLKLED